MQRNKQKTKTIDWDKKIKEAEITGDRTIIVFQEEYRGFKYEIHVLHDKALKSDPDLYKGTWVTLEVPKGLNELYGTISDFLNYAKEGLSAEGLYAYSFCYDDTAHDFNKGQDIDTRIKLMREKAHSDINAFYVYLEQAGRVLDGVRRIKDAVSWLDKLGY